ncbi:MAG: phospholipase D family protein [Armatimonadota bacterium]|jgi:phosphatidylserine/phosphatidylglycerophosphate/cardiolipin synthase-like enzyme
MSSLAKISHSFKRYWPLALLLLVMALTGCDDQSLTQQTTKPAPAPPQVSQPPAPAAAETHTALDYDIYFSPRGGCTDAIVKAIDSAKQTVRIQAYSFTSARIAKALLDARKKGVDVQVILDKSQVTQQYSSADFLHNSDIPVFIDRAHAIAHNKVIVIDQKTVITGSFNFTKAAEERNAENLLVIRDGNLASRYTQNWEEHLAHSEPYQGRN